MAGVAVTFDNLDNVNTKKDDYDKQTACKAPVRWSKYTTGARHSVLNRVLVLNGKTIK